MLDDKKLKLTIGHAQSERNGVEGFEIIRGDQYSKKIDFSPSLTYPKLLYAAQVVYPVLHKI